jgi:pilus assembly protein CpaB
MNRRISIIISCALVLSACASYLVYRAVGVRAGNTRQVPTTRIIVAARDLELGALIRSSDLSTAAWPGALPKGAITKTDGILNRGIVSAIYEGEPITENRLAREGSGGGLAGTIPPGMRACAVRVNEVVGVAGFVVPGMRVDVLVTGLPPGGNPLDGPQVRTLLQNIQVLSAGTNFQRDQAGKPEQAQVVSLLVTPAQAEILSLASNETHIQLVLRNPMDTQVSKPPGTMVADLFGNVRAPMHVPPDRPVPSKKVVERVELPAARPVAPPPAAPAPYTVEMLNGALHTEAKFSLPASGPREQQ